MLFIVQPWLLHTVHDDAWRDLNTAAKGASHQQGLLHIMYHWSRRYIDRPAKTFNAGEVEESWAVYVGQEKEGNYPDSLAAIAQTRETDFKRAGSLDTPLRTAMPAAYKAATDKNSAAYETARQAVYFRFHTLYYLSIAKRDER